MKKYLVFITIAAFALFAFAFSSCEKMMGNFLDKAPSTDVTEDTIFSSKQNVLDFLTSIYEYGVHSNLPYASSPTAGRVGYANPEATLWSGTSDESQCTTSWYFPTIWNQGNVNSTSGGGNIDGRFDYRFTAIRMISVLLDRIDAVPEDDTNNWKEQYKAEARIIRAMNYFEMLKRYGGMPIIDQRLDPNEDIDLTRKSIKSMVDFIVSDCDAAINSPSLPAYYSSATPDELALKGRVHKGVAYAIKSKTLLYAASPLFNTATPYLDFGSNDSIICYGDYSNDRWKLAADAAKDALDWAASSGCVLLKSYLDTWNLYDNDEIIFAEKTQSRIGRWVWPWGEFSRYWPPNQGYGGTSPTLNFIKRYENKQGNQVAWNGGDDLQEKMLSLDTRFAQTVVYNMGWLDAAQTQPAYLYQEAIQNVEKGPSGLEGAISKCVGGFWLHKGRPYAISDQVWAYAPNSTLYQLNEIYLNYAEALYEYNANGGNGDAAADAKPGGYTLSARDAINVIRQRAGQPAILTGHSFYPDFRELIRNERTIELAFDNHRFWDIRRWMIAEQDGVMQGDMWGIIINIIDPSITIDKAPANSGYKYTPYVFARRKFLRRMYLHPITIDNVNRGLLQNPGY